METPARTIPRAAAPLDQTARITVNPAPLPRPVAATPVTKTAVIPSPSTTAIPAPAAPAKAAVLTPKAPAAAPRFDEEATDSTMLTTILTAAIAVCSLGLAGVLVASYCQLF